MAESKESSATPDVPAGLQDLPAADGEETRVKGGLMSQFNQAETLRSGSKSPRDAASGLPSG